MSNKAILIIGVLLVLLTIGFASFLFRPGSDTVEMPKQIDPMAEPTSIVMYKNEGCECCTKWAAHMEAEGFSVKEVAVPNLNDIKQENGISYNLSSCHTAKVGGYIVEGHVPVADVQRLLEEQPEAIGLTVPGMPIGSPGMEVPGREADHYDVLLIHKDGSTSVYSSY
ncbi:MAG: DUF411 domain-containing protein [Bacteroidota bacterium]